MTIKFTDETIREAQKRYFETQTPLGCAGLPDCWRAAASVFEAAANAQAPSKLAIGGQRFFLTQWREDKDFDGQRTMKVSLSAMRVHATPVPIDEIKLTSTSPEFMEVVKGIKPGQQPELVLSLAVATAGAIDDEPACEGAGNHTHNPTDADIGRALLTSGIDPLDAEAHAALGRCARELLAPPATAGAAAYWSRRAQCAEHSLEEAKIEWNKMRELYEGTSLDRYDVLACAEHAEAQVGDLERRVDGLATELYRANERLERARGFIETMLRPIPEDDHEVGYDIALKSGYSTALKSIARYLGLTIAPARELTVTWNAPATETSDEI